MDQAGGSASLSLVRELPKVPSWQKGCGTAYLVQTTRPYRSDCVMVKFRHRYYEPRHFVTSSTPVHIDCQNLELAFRKDDAQLIAVDSSFHEGRRRCFWTSDHLRFPLVAYSVDQRHTASGKLGEPPWDVFGVLDLGLIVACSLQFPRRRKHGILVLCCTYTPG